MKRKNLTALVSGLLCLSVLSSCTGLSNKIAFKNGWNYSSPSSYATIDETLVYNVTFEKSEIGFQNSYNLNYENGSYTTHLQSIKLEDGREAYKYTTELNISPVYTYQGQSTKNLETGDTLKDYVTSEVVFLPASNSFRPISSKKTIYSHSPSGGTVSSLKTCYSLDAYTVETSYATYPTGKTTITRTPLAESESVVTRTHDFDIDTEDYNYLDNEQLLLAIRGLPDSMTANNVLVYSPFTKAVQGISLSVGTAQSEATNDAANAAKSFSFLWNGTEIKEQPVAYRAIALSISSENPGATQTALVAKANDASKNTYRNVILELETPLAYSLGSLIYKLESATYVE